MTIPPIGYILPSMKNKEELYSWLNGLVIESVGYDEDNKVFFIRLDNGESLIISTTLIARGLPRA